ncbi:MAG: hypothetical protein ACYC0X_23605 [Pirellulaceae bacterium]
MSRSAERSRRQISCYLDGAMVVIDHHAHIGRCLATSPMTDRQRSGRCAVVEGRVLRITEQSSYFDPRRSTLSNGSADRRIGAAVGHIANGQVALGDDQSFSIIYV